MKSSSMVLVALMGPGSALAQALPLQPGEYAISAVTAVTGAEVAKPQTASRCIKPGDLANPETVLNNRFMANFKPDATCTISNLSIASGAIGYSTDCKFSEVRVEGSLTANSFSVVRRAKPKGGGGPGVETRLEGKRTGACS